MLLEALVCVDFPFSYVYCFLFNIAKKHLNVKHSDLHIQHSSMDPHASGLPFQAQAHDAMRHGLASLKEDAMQKHPVDTIQASTAVPGCHYSNPQMMRDLFGLAFPAKVDIEKQILSKFGRLPGLPSSRLGLESLTGELDQFGFESYLGLPEFSEQLPVDMHSQMEQRLGMGSSTKPLARGMF